MHKDDPEERAARIRAITPGGRGADVAIECAGLPEVWEQTWRCLRPGGTADATPETRPGAELRRGMLRP